MKYTDLPDKWKRKAEEMEISLVRAMFEEHSRDEGYEFNPNEITIDDEIVQDNLNGTDYGFERDLFTRDKILIRI